MSLPYRPIHAALFLLLGWAPLSVPAAPEPVAAEATLGLDLERGILELRSAAGERVVPLEADSLRAALTAVVQAFARGRDAEGARRRAAELLLRGHQDVLGAAPRWRCRIEGPEALPGVWGAIATLPLPGQGGRVVAERHRLVFDWPRRLLASRPRASGAHGDRVLLLAPFRTGHEPRADDPDTLRRALQAALRHVDLIPRNDTRAPVVRRILERQEHALLWLRAPIEGLGELRPVLDRFPPLLVWTLPGDAPAGLALTSRSIAAGGEHVPALVAQGWPVPERELAPLVRHFADALARGMEVEEALAQASRAGIAAGQPPRIWAALSLVGRPGIRPQPSRAGWLQRWVGRWRGPRWTDRAPAAGESAP